MINGNARVGKNCRLYGNNCIGNDGIHSECPVIGDNVRICVGAKIIGDVSIANNVIVAAGAVVNKDCLKEGAGIPAKIIGSVSSSKEFLD